MIKLIFFKILAIFLNPFESQTLRALYKRWYGVQVGMYSYGCFDPRRIPRKAVIGRYCSFSNSCRFFVRDHGMNFLALHPYLYNSSLGIVSEEKIEQTSFTIEDDVWVGHNATITSKATMLGRGCVIAANSVVTSSVPRYAVVAGNPSRIIKYRFPKKVIDEIEKTEWWKLDKTQFKKIILSNPEMIYEPGKYFDR